ncbi:hypothetical protein HNP92_001814 [Methanococcus maripaludis]|uniref:Uncharacterized protein n=1 Tax=Methanococcus maripaludis TaxID=39152 RepID=A0A7J9S6S7_METMI|nr:hypothetical protein [Methanococcus maripaludis]MBB6402492.1 hypothetical protein [Methanococcus maripaludis]
MIKLISDIIFLISVLILLKTWYNVYEVAMVRYEKFAVRLLITVILCTITSLSFILPLYSLFYVKILLPAVPVEYIKLQSAVIILTSTLICRYIAITAKNALADYCLKKGIITKRDPEESIFVK